MTENDDTHPALAALHGWWERLTGGESAGTAELDALIRDGERAPRGEALARLLAMAYHARWDADRTHFDDADRAIGLWREVLGVAPDDPGAAYFCGTLLTYRAERTRAPEDIAEAERLAAIATGAFDDADSWYLSGWIHLVGATATGDADGLAEALRRFATASSRDPEGDMRCQIVREQLRTAFGLYHEGRLTPERFRVYADRGRELLDDPGDVSVPMQTLLAGTVAMVEIGTAVREDRAHDFTLVRDLVDRYRDVELPDPHLRAELDAARSQLDGIAGTEGDLDRGVSAAGRFAASDRFSDGRRANLTESLALARANRAVLEGDLAALAEAVAQLRAAADPAMRSLATIIEAAGESKRIASGGDEAAAKAVLEKALDGLPADDQVPVTMRGLLAGLLGGGAPVADGGAPTSPLDAAGRLGALLAEVRDAAGRGDLVALRRLAVVSAEILEHIPEDYPALRITACDNAGVAELEVARRDRADHGAAERATGHLAAACALAGGPHHALWPQLAVEHGMSLRYGAKPDLAGSRAAGRSGLLAYTWAAMIQADTGRALESAVWVARHVRTVAGWCVSDLAGGVARADGSDRAAGADLVAVLDAGRGLALHAATASRSMPDRLAGAGHPELAAAWRANGGAGGAPDDNLRVRALHALTAGSEVFGTPEPDEIRHALTATGSDALVYLVPAGEACAGMAVVVPVAGPVAVLPLPDLDPGQVPMLRGSASVVRDPGPSSSVARDLGPDHGDDGDGALDRVCRWAWRACMKALVEYAGGWRLRRPARLVLVPTGMLGRVPWHAARHDDHTGRHYAIERLVVSYHVSARMFCATAGRPLRPPRSALIVGDSASTPPLPYAVAEARAVHRDFHPGGTLLDRATPADVLDWIATPGRGPSLLHLACHGHVDPARPAEARLALAGGDLPVLRLLADARSAGLDLDRVVLSACSTGAVGSQHDEAVSLATAFLAGGAHTVFGSLWPVPDPDTARLMYALHHHLTVSGHPPADALRLAQLAMLDPAGAGLPEMPPELATAGGGTDHAWAAFVHLGR
ncbi:CHAT domain-containing protein [Actinoplanes sp. NPDC051851]|uniref:CHAT domain-containing protein n=1 Tax=Actinoplanes sp. NPDC051851 TaxID=3154753 RepID=UPI0034386E2A